MNVTEKTREQLIAEVEELHRRVAGLERELARTTAIGQNRKSTGQQPPFPEQDRHAPDKGAGIQSDERPTPDSPVEQTLSDRSQTEEALQIACQQLLGIIDFLPDATFVIDEERRVIAWNHAIEEMTGVAEGEIIGQGEYAYAIPFYGERRPILVDRVFDRELRFKHHYDFVVEKGNTIYAEAYVPNTYQGKGAYLWVKASPLFDESGRMIGAIESIRDITERKDLEEAHRINAEKIKLFAYSISHDLKSPLIGIHGLTRLLYRRYRDYLDEKGKLYCDQILKATEQAVALVDEINIYIRTKEIPLHFEVFKPSETIKMVRDEFGALLSMRRIAWLEPDPIPEIKADRLSLLRVLRNLVDNALKYGGKRLTTIRIGYKETEDFHVFSVSDDGVGIRHEDSEKIFGLFQRNETSRGVEGTGLGLAIVKEIAEKHRGKVWAERGAVGGTVFRIFISRHL
jgi:PAS domain S-box-containing protein